MNTLRIRSTNGKLKRQRKHSKFEDESESSSGTDFSYLETPTPKTENENSIVGRRKPNLSSVKRLGVQRVKGEQPLARDATGNDNKSKYEEDRSDGTLHAATSAALNRFRGIATIRSGRLANRGKGAAAIATATSRDKNTDSDSNENSDSTGPRRGTPRVSTPVRNASANDIRVPPPLILERPASAEGGSKRRGSMEVWETGIAALFDDSDDEGSDEEDTSNHKERRGSSIELDQEEQEYAATARSNWASTLMASTIARRKSVGKAPLSGGCPYMLPDPADTDNKVRRELQSIIRYRFSPTTRAKPTRLEAWAASLEERDRGGWTGTLECTDIETLHTLLGLFMCIPMTLRALRQRHNKFC